MVYVLVNTMFTSWVFKNFALKLNPDVTKSFRSSPLDILICDTLRVLPLHIISLPSGTIISPEFLIKSSFIFK